MDMGKTYPKVTRQLAPQATICWDPYHVVAVRREALFVRVGCKDPPPVCRSRPVKLEAA
jgi:hypothetical protein